MEFVFFWHLCLPTRRDGKLSTFNLIVLTHFILGGTFLSAVFFSLLCLVMLKAFGIGVPLQILDLKNYKIVWKLWQRRIRISCKIKFAFHCCDSLGVLWVKFYLFFIARGKETKIYKRRQKCKKLQKKVIPKMSDFTQHTNLLLCIPYKLHSFSINNAFISTKYNLRNSLKIHTNQNTVVASITRPT